MQTVTIKIHVPRAAAITAGHIAYGDTTYELSPEQLGELNGYELSALLRFEGSAAIERLQVEGYSAEPWPFIKQALAETVAENERAKERRAARDLAEAELKRWARNGPPAPSTLPRRKITRLAENDYDVGSAYVFALAQSLADIDPQLGGMTPPIVTCTEQFDKNACLEDRGNPSLFALTLESRVRLQVAVLASACAPGTKIAVPQVQRLMPKHGQRQTVVVARVSHPATGYGATVVWSAEDNRALPGEVQELRDPGPEVG